MKLNMNIQTGKGTIPLITLVSILSISLVVNLPGLAITPVLSNIKHIFPSSSELEVQMLTVLPNLFIIPFVLLSGKLSVSRSKIMLLILGLTVYILSGIFYFFARSMTELIMISCLLGIGSGIVIPIAAGLIADYFTGKYRMKQLGIKSGIANFALVLATLAVGVLAKENWRLPFVVYLTPVIPLLLAPFLRSKHYGGVKASVPTGTKRPAAAGSAKAIPTNTTTEHDNGTAGRIDWKKLAGIALLYGIATYGCGAINLYLPFLAAQYRIDDSVIGVITAVFFCCIMLSGFLLPRVIKILRGTTLPAAIFMMCAGLLLGYFSRDASSLGLSACIVGLGYGIIQPVAYDKSVETASGKSSTLALSILLAANYLAITLTPFIVDFFKDLFRAGGNQFPYLLDTIIMGILLGASILYKHKFTFAVNKNYT